MRTDTMVKANRFDVGFGDWTGLQGDRFSDLREALAFAKMRTPGKINAVVTMAGTQTFMGQTIPMHGVEVCRVQGHRIVGWNYAEAGADELPEYAALIRSVKLPAREVAK